MIMSSEKHISDKTYQITSRYYIMRKEYIEKILAKLHWALRSVLLQTYCIVRLLVEAVPTKPISRDATARDGTEWDYCNALLHGTLAVTIQKLQRVLNNAARIVFQASRRSDASPQLHRLHWFSAGLIIVPVVPWEGLPRRQGPPINNCQFLPHYFDVERTFRNQKFRGSWQASCISII